MNDELQKHVADLLLMLKNGIEKGSQVAGEQLPDLAMQYVLWGRVYMTFMSVASVSVAAFIAYRANKLAKEEDIDPFYVWMLAGGCIAICLTPLMATLPETLMVWFAPKVWLLKEIAQVLK